MKPSSPNKLINFLAALFLGTAGGLGLAVFMEYLNPSVSSDEDIEQAIGAGVIAWVPELTEQQMAILRNRNPTLGTTRVDTSARVGVQIASDRQV